MSEKKAPVKNQHFVPQFYLRNFSSDKKSIGAYILKSGTFIKQASISSQASKNYFYSDDMEIEVALSQIEADAAESVTKLLQNPHSKISVTDYKRLLFYSVIQLGRTVTAADGSVDSAKLFYHETQAYSSAFGDTFPQNEKEAIPKTPVLGSLYTHALAYKTGMFDNLRYRILINKTRSPFITGDTPACLYNQFRERLGSFSYALASKGFQLYLPLSPNVAIFFYDPQSYKVGFKKQTSIYIQSIKDVDEFNKLIASYARNTLFIPPNAVSSLELQKFARYSQNYKVSTTQIIQTGDLTPNQRYIYLRTVATYCRFSPSFIKELDKSKIITSQNTDKDDHLQRPEAIRSKQLMDLFDGYTIYEATNNGKF